MIMTARQAEELFCPLLSSGGTRAKCNAERCPLWRWFDSDMVRDIDHPQDLKVGYCGAGGRPEVHRLEAF